MMTRSALAAKTPRRDGGPSDVALRVQPSAATIVRRAKHRALG